jgi:hypothetical protein
MVQRLTFDNPSFSTFLLPWFFLLSPVLSSFDHTLTSCWRFRQYLSAIYNKRLASDETSFW